MNAHRSVAQHNNGRPMRPVLRLLGAIAVCALVSGLFGVVGPHSSEPASASPTLETGASFNSPGDDELVKRVQTMIDGTGEGESIEIAQYRLRDHVIYEALRDAVDRGVHVRMLVDHGMLTAGSEEQQKEFLDLQQEFNSDDDSETWIRVCAQEGAEMKRGAEGAVGGAGKPTGGAGGEADEDPDIARGEVDGVTGCNGDNAMHNKFYLFSNTMGRDGVAVTSSANLSNDSIGGTGGFNSMYTHVEDPAERIGSTLSGDTLFERFHDYFGQLSAVALDPSKRDPDYYGTNPPEISGKTKTYFFPRASGDTTVNTLDVVDCKEQPSTKIRVGMWSLARKAVAKALAEKAATCEVDIVVNRTSQDVCDILTEDFPENLRIRTFVRDEEGSDSDEGIHEKNMTIGGNYNGDNHRRVVFTGSGNFNNLSLRHNDENMVRILDDSEVYGDFIRHFDDDLMDSATVDIADKDDCAKLVVD